MADSYAVFLRYLNYFGVGVRMGHTHHYERTGSQRVRTSEEFRKTIALGVRQMCDHVAP